MRTVIVVEVHHSKPLPHLADMVAGRAYTIDGVTNAEVVKDNQRSLSVEELQALGFSMEEISLGCEEA